MNAGPSCDWLPEWIAALGGACWVCDPGGRVVHANPEAAALIARGVLGDPGPACHAVVGGLDESGRSACRPECEPLRRARAEEPIEPFLMRLGGRRGAGRWFLVWIIPLTAPDGSRPWLVHCACDVDRFHRMEEYLREVAARSPGRDVSRRAPRRRLTAREAEVLALLAHDQDARRIAARLFLSHSTVRNHVAHILDKLGVHSVQEAVAWRLLQGGAGPDSAPGGAPRTGRGTRRGAGRPGEGGDAGDAGAAAGGDGDG